MPTDRAKKEREHLKYRRKVLPAQLALARRRYQHLLREANRLGMHHILREDER